MDCGAGRRGDRQAFPRRNAAEPQKNLARPTHPATATVLVLSERSERSSSSTSTGKSSGKIEDEHEHEHEARFHRSRNPGPDRSLRLAPGAIPRATTGGRPYSATAWCRTSRPIHSRSLAIPSQSARTAKVTHIATMITMPITIALTSRTLEFFRLSPKS